MSSVRITAAGAVAVVVLCSLTGPVRACDERFVKRCEKISAAVAAREEAQAAGPAVRQRSSRVRVVFSVRSRHGRIAKRTRAPGFTVARQERGQERGMVLASDNTRMTSLIPESALARRFRGFIDPQPMAQNAFEQLRKPHLVALNMDATPALPVTEAAPAQSEQVSTRGIDPIASPAAMAKQDRIAIASPAADTVVSRPVALAELPAAKPAAVIAPVARPAVAEANVLTPPALTAPQSKPQVIVTEAPVPAPADQEPSGFSIHKLVLALCGALGAASALRFIVGT